VVDAALLNILVCPDDRGPLLYVDDDSLRETHGTAEFLYNPRLRRAYRVDGGIPVLLIDEAFAVSDDAAHQRMLDHAADGPVS
jgi:uncharacterized protein